MKSICVIQRKPTILLTPKKTVRLPPVRVIDWQAQAHYFNEGVTVFTMIYCGLNWWMYKRINERK